MSKYANFLISQAAKKGCEEQVRAKSEAHSEWTAHVVCLFPLTRKP